MRVRFWSAKRSHHGLAVRRVPRHSASAAAPGPRTVLTAWYMGLRWRGPGAGQGPATAGSRMPGSGCCAPGDDGGGAAGHALKGHVRCVAAGSRTGLSGASASRWMPLAVAAYDQIIGLDLGDVAVDGCITKAPCGGPLAGPSPVTGAKAA